MSKRFSKTKVLDTLELLMCNLENEHGFRRGDGYSRVTGKGDAVNRAFGAYDAYRDLYDDICDGDLKLL